MRRLVERGKPRWERLIALLDAASRHGLRSFSADRLDELTRLYRQATSDLAQARTRRHDPRLVAYLNDLVGRAAGLIYGGRRRRRLHLGEFFLRRVPQTFRRTLVYSGIAFGISASASLLAYQAAAANPAWADALFQEFSGAREVSLREVVESFLEKDQPSGAYFEMFQRILGADNLTGLIAVNNIQVAFRAFALGLTFGLGTIRELIVTGLMVGGFIGAGAHYDRAADLIAVVAPHGVLELSAIFICAGAGLMLGWSLIDPGDRPRVQALSAAARDAIVLVLACLPIFAVAAAIEGFLSPMSAGLFRANGPRIAFGAMTGVLLYAYLLFGDAWRRPHAAGDEPS